MTSLKNIFVRDYNSKPIVHMIVVVVKLPTGALELIVNHTNLEEKFAYYLETYDENMKMYKNNAIEIVDWMIV